MKQLRYVPKKRKCAKEDTKVSIAQNKISAKENEIRIKIKDLAFQNYYEMLGISTDASSEDVRKAFFREARKYHPDKLPSAFSTELRDVAQDVFSRLSTAHSALVDPDARKEYNCKIARKKAATSKAPPPTDKSKLHTILHAEKLYHKSLVYERQNQIDKALEAIERAKSLNPEEGNYLAVWAHLQERLRPREASCGDLIEKLKQASQWNPRSERIMLYLAQVLRRDGQNNSARAYYEKVLEVNPNNKEASRELGLMNMGKKEKHKKSKGKGLLERVLK